MDGCVLFSFDMEIGVWGIGALCSGLHTGWVVGGVVDGIAISSWLSSTQIGFNQRVESV